MIKTALLITVCFLLACTSKPNSRYLSDNYGRETAPSVYTVKSGDTLFSIAWRFGLEQQSIMSKNAIKNPNKIFVGQRLRLKSPGKSSSRPQPTASTKPATIARKGKWAWPMKGKITRRFNAGRIGANGIRIAGKPNQTINASQGGKVVYKGNGLKGYGNVIIIKHSNNLLSAYGFLSKTDVKVGQTIRKRQRIGTVGYGPGNKLMLHYEVRKNGKPVNPLSYIGSSYHF